MTTSAAETASQPPARLASLDALRGFDMLWITGGAPIAATLERLCCPGSNLVREQLDHVGWVGMHFEDLIMPLFMFLAGVSLPFATASRLAKKQSLLQLWRHTLTRVALLWIFGMYVQGNLTSWNPDRWIYYSNTLQAIAAGFFVAFICHLHLPRRGQYVTAAALLLVSWAVYAWVPVPGGTAGDYSERGNIALWIDKALMGKHHDGTSYTWIFSSLNFGVTTLLGVFAGNLLRKDSITGNRKTLLLAGAGAGAIAVALCWAPFHPIIKHIWTGSFTLLSGGLSLLLLAIFYWVIDVRGWRRWSYFFTVIGANAIAAYMLNNTVSFGGLSGRFFGGLSLWLPKPAMALVGAVGPVLLLWLVLRLLYRNKIFLKV